MRLGSVVVALALMLSAACAQLGTIPYSGAQGPAAFTPAWQDLKIGAGGNVSAIASLSDGTLVARGDVFSGWVYHPSTTCTLGGTTLAAPCWQNTVTVTSLGSYYNFNTSSGGGNMSPAGWGFCPSNTNVAYATIDGKLFGTTNKGGAWFKVGQTTQLTTNMFSNGGGSTEKLESIACDPNNPDTVIVATVSDHFYKVTNGRSGLSATVAALPAPVAATGAQAGTVTYQIGSSSNLMVCVYGTGCYTSTDGGASFMSRVAGGPTNVYKLLADKFNSYWISDLSKVWKFVGTTWSSPLTLSNISGIAVDPASASQGVNRIAAITREGQLSVSDNDGTNWFGSWEGGTQTFTVPAVQPQWFTTAAYAGSQFLNMNDITIDPSGMLWAAGGIGAYNSNQQSGDPAWVNIQTNASAGIGSSQLCFASLPATVRAGMRVYDPVTFFTFTPTTVSSISSNCVNLSHVTINGTIVSGTNIIFTATPYYSVNASDQTEMVLEQVVVPPNGIPVTCQWDRGVMPLPNPDVYGTYQWNSNADNTAAINGCWGADWAAGTANTITAGIVQQANVPASSINGGYTWTQWPTNPPSFNFGVTVGAWSSTHWLVMPGQGLNVAYRTDNGGSTWTGVTFTGATPSNFVGNYATNAQPVTADRVTADNFYIVDSASSPQVFKCTGAQAATTCAFQGSITVPGGFVQNLKLSAMPTRAGYVFYSAGSVASSNGLYKSTAGGASMTRCNANLDDVLGFGFGAAKSGAIYPTIYVNGYLSSALGFYYSTDACATWTAINVPSAGNTNLYPLDFPYQLMHVNGDMSVYGRVYVGFLTGAGGAYIDTQDACPSVNWGSVKPNDSLTSTVSLTATKSGLVPVNNVKFYVDGTLIGTQTVPTGTPPTYTQSWVTGGVSNGSHLITVATEDNAANGCTTNVFSGTISGTSGTINSGTAPKVGQTLAFAGMTAAPPMVTAQSGSTFTVSHSQSASAVAMVGSQSAYTIPITTH